MNPLQLRKIGAALGSLALAGCASGPSVGPPSSGLASSTQQRRFPPPCTPTVWAASLSSSTVYGYDATNALCVTLSGTYDGLPLNAPITVAIGKAPKYLYVADLGNNRIAVFTYAGTFVKAWSTTLGTQLYQPWGVCVSQKGIVGVANRQYNNTGAPGIVEFFSATAPNGSTPSGYASGVLNAYEYCAFDKATNFFVDGFTSAGPTKIGYLSHCYVNLNAQTVLDSGLGAGTSFEWAGMFSRITSPATDRLSVATYANPATNQTIKNWKVTAPTACGVAFGALANETLNYGSQFYDDYQLAPTALPGTGHIYVADYYDGTIWSSATRLGGAITSYDSVSGPVGVATQPTGQY